MRDSDGLDQALRYEKSLVGIRIYFEDGATGFATGLNTRLLGLSFSFKHFICKMWTVMRSKLKIVVSTLSVSLSLLEISLYVAANFLYDWVITFLI